MMLSALPGSTIAARRSDFQQSVVERPGIGTRQRTGKFWVNSGFGRWGSNCSAGAGVIGARPLCCCRFGGGIARVVGRGALDEAQQFAAADDPVQMADGALDRVFSQGAAEREIQSALAAGDVDLAQKLSISPPSAMSRSIQVWPRTPQVEGESGSVTDTDGRYAKGLWTGALGSREPRRHGRWRPFRVRRYSRCGARGRALLDRSADQFSGPRSRRCRDGRRRRGACASLGVGTPTQVGLTLVEAARRSGRLRMQH